MREPGPDVLRELESVSRCDNALGGYSDYEGGGDGPTAESWRRGKAAFDEQCDRAVRDHMAAVNVWRRLKRINARS